MARFSPLMALPPLVFASIAALFLWGMGKGDGAGATSVLVGKPAPALPDTALPGLSPVLSEDLRTGKVTLVNVWASWCPPCRAEHPTLTALKEEGIPVMGVNLRDTEANALSFLREHGNPFAKVSTDPTGRGAIDWGVTAPPETFIVDGDGTVLYRHAGPLIREDYTGRFRPQLDKALADQR